MVAVACQAMTGADCQAATAKRTGAQTVAQATGKPHGAIRHLAVPDLAPPARLAPVNAQPALPDRLRGLIRRVALPMGDKRLALTFDLCERTVHVTGYDAALVQVLRQGEAKATFFAGGKWMRSHPEATLSLMADPRFELANHTWSHANLGVMQGQKRLDQVLWTSAQAELLREELDARRVKAGKTPLGPQPMTLLRLPYGRGGAEAVGAVNALGLAVIQWDVVGEGGGGSVAARASAIAEAVRPGSIVLLHANQVPKDTAALVRALLPLLRQRGYATATVSELLQAGVPETVEDGYFSVPGDNRVYDDLFEDQGTGARVNTKVGAKTRAGRDR
ncbi:MAG: polysaccharide deacetylase family protein [Proteobacteria bacterium]|nr:polysaccharide deacetylase family protein [Pseudomonadota bacterium]